MLCLFNKQLKKINMYCYFVSFYGFFINRVFRFLIFKLIYELYVDSIILNKVYKNIFCLDDNLFLKGVVFDFYVMYYCYYF